MAQEKDNITFFEVDNEPNDELSQNKFIVKLPVPGDFYSLYDELKAKCNPKNFAYPYNPDKIEIANNIYEQLMKFDKFSPNEGELKQLRKKAQVELGIQFSTVKKFNMLTNVCKIENYADENYDAKKISLANALNVKIFACADDIDALEEIEIEARDLMEDYSEKFKKSDDSEYMSLFIFTTIFTILIMLIFFISMASQSY